jgi:hypothetical protein
MFKLTCNKYFNKHFNQKENQNENKKEGILTLNIEKEIIGSSLDVSIDL